MNMELLVKELDAKIPRDCVSQRSGGGNRSLSYLEAHYVIDRMNKLFGNLGWNRETIILEPLAADPTVYRAKVRVTVTVDSVTCVKEGTGVGNAQKGSKVDHELAIKEAESDAFKRAAMQFGMSLGLALYDKSQENVEDAAPAPKLPQKGAVAAIVAVAKETAPAKRDVAQLKEIIRNSARILNDTRKLPIADFKVKFLQSAGVVKVDELSDAQTLSLFDTLKTSFPELKLS